MGYWGWRPMGAGLLGAVFASVLVVGCTLIASPTATAAWTATFTPQITLTVGRIGPPVPPITGEAVTLLPGDTTPPAETIPTTTATLIEPTAAPAPTATPVVYTIQSGDTLLDIALRYDIPLETLRAANPQAAGLLQVGQQLVIPPPSTSMPDEEDVAESISLTLATPTPLPMRAESPACYALTDERALCLGLVYNVSSETVVSVQVRVQSGEGETAALVTAAVDQPILEPGSAGVYVAEIAWSGDTPGGDLAALRTVEVASADPAASAAYVTLAVQDVSQQQEGRHYALSGQVRNTTGQAVAAARLYLALVDAQSRVIGYRVVELPGTLEAGDSASFSAQVSSFTDAVEAQSQINAVGRSEPS